MRDALCSSGFEILIRNTNNADFINTFFVFIIQSLHQIKYAFECGTNTKNRVIKDEKCGDGILYVHSFVLFMRSTPWQNAITKHNMCWGLQKNMFDYRCLWNLVDINTSQIYLKSSITVIISKCFHEDGICLESYKMIINYLKRCWYRCFIDI